MCTTHRISHESFKPCLHGSRRISDVGHCGSHHWLGHGLLRFVWPAKRAPTASRCLGLGLGSPKFQDFSGFPKVSKVSKFPEVLEGSKSCILAGMMCHHVREPNGQEVWGGLGVPKAFSGFFYT